MTIREPYLSLADVALTLDVSVRDIAQLIADGELPAIRVGGQQRVTQSSLEEYLADQHEQQRRSALWQESQTASVIDLFGPRSK
ncbi:helix-turn-helix domain-containing protein [Agrococcus casei]|uniref:helix-turn-helix domain-containing protein n=1 Tax=Agrococcus casei TaxID=343512 RepID=UPI003F8E96A5